jgi:hypothetical protein
LQACHTLRNLSTGHADIQTKIVREGGVVAILDAMNNEQVEKCLSISICKIACSALANLAKLNEDNQIIIEREGGIAAIVAAMKAHPDESKLQTLACEALEKLLWEDDDCASVNNCICVAMKEEGGISAIVTAMKTHPDETELQTHGCNALGVLPGNVVEKDGGIAVIVDAMKAHPNDYCYLQAAACGALTSLSRRDDAAVNNSISVAIEEEGGISALVTAMTAMKEHLRYCVLQRDCCRALGNFPVNAVEKNGGIAAIADAMKQDPSDPDLQLATCGALRKFSDDTDSKLPIVEAGGIVCLLGAMVYHPRDEDILDAASYALEKLTVDCEKGARAFLRANIGVGLIWDRTEAFPNHYDLKERACTILMNVYNIAEKLNPHRYRCLDVICSILSQMQFVPPNSFVQFLHQKIVLNKSEPRLCRARAEMALGVRHWHDHDLEAAGDCFRDVVGFARENPSLEKEERKHTFIVAGGSQLPVATILGNLSRIAQDRLDRLVSQDIVESEPNIFVITVEWIDEEGTPMPECRRETRLCIGTKGDSISKPDVRKILTVGGERCEDCGKSRKEARLVCLHCCNRCKV